MADAPAGRLIAVDGTHGGRVSEVAAALHDGFSRRHVPCGISRWDASGLFGDVIGAPIGDRRVSPRTLLLLYAADLAFRLRWEIQPGLEQGLTIVAAPYTATAIGFGVASGLPGPWLESLFRFAPVPARSLILRDRKSEGGWQRKPARGWCECCAALLDRTAQGFARKKTRLAMMAALATAAEDHGGRTRPRDVKRVVSTYAARSPGSRVTDLPARAVKSR